LYFIHIKRDKATVYTLGCYYLEVTLWIFFSEKLALQYWLSILSIAGFSSNRLLLLITAD
jgi:hypothetical protein